MKSVAIIVLMFLSFNLFPQSGDMVIEYREINDTYYPNQLTAMLYVHDGITIFLPKYSTQNTINPKQQKYFSNRKDVFLDWFYLKTDHVKEKMFFFDGYGSNTFLIEDGYQKLNWQITPESKQIGNYQCIKATLNFRGLDWEVWFTPDIPVPYGPWKLYGLPGLIIEACSADKVYTWQLEKIEYKKDEVFNKDFKTLVETRNSSPISIEEFIESKDEFHANAYAKRKKDDPQMAEYVPIRTGYELRYEWEE